MDLVSAIVNHTFVILSRTKEATIQRFEFFLIRNCIDYSTYYAESGPLAHINNLILWQIHQKPTIEHKILFVYIGNTIDKGTETWMDRELWMTNGTKNILPTPSLLYAIISKLKDDLYGKFKFSMLFVDSKCDEGNFVNHFTSNFIAHVNTNIFNEELKCIELLKKKPKNEPNLEIHQACFNGDLAKIVELLSSKVDCYVLDNNGFSPLFYCIWGAAEEEEEKSRNYLIIIELLVRMAPGIQVVESSERMSPLYLACLLENIDIVLIITQLKISIARRRLKKMIFKQLFAHLNNITNFKPSENNDIMIKTMDKDIKAILATTWDLLQEKLNKIEKYNDTVTSYFVCSSMGYIITKQTPTNGYTGTGTIIFSKENFSIVLTSAHLIYSKGKYKNCDNGLFVAGCNDSLVLYSIDQVCSPFFYLNEIDNHS